MKFLQVCFLFFFLSACQTQAPKKTAKATRPTLEDILSQKLSQPADIVKWLKSCQKDCLQPDAEIAGDLASGYDILFSLAAKNPNYEKLSAQEKKVAIEGQKKVRDGFVKILKFKNSRDILQTALQELSSPTSLYSFGDSDFDSLVQETIDRLKNQPETRATGFYFQAISLPPRNENLLNIIEAYRQCFLVSGQQQDRQCREQYDDAVSYYERPRCRQGNFNKGVRFVSSVDATKAVLTEDDLLETSLEVFGQEDPRFQHYELWFNLKTFSADKLEKFTQSQLKKNVELLLQYEKRTLSKAKVLQKIVDGQFRMIFPNQVEVLAAFQTICRKPTPELLPEHLKIK